MPGLDFAGLGGRSASDTATEPRRIFTALPAKDAKYAYPRDVQSDVWDQWHRRRNDADIVIKMNTGGGKTVVGLLTLKSSLNENVGPAVYLSPDNYLAEQVRREAQALGIETTDDPRSDRFQTGRALLVTSIYRLVNGQSVFGVRADDRPRIEIGTLLVDDAHACLATVEEQFTLQVAATHGAYAPILRLFENDLQRQSPPTLRDIQEGVRSAVMEIPYWSWADRNQQVLEILHAYRDDETFRFKWPLIQESLHLCRAAISADGIEIQPPCIPRDQIPSMSRARRRLYLTATLADDSVLVTHFAADPASVARPITPATADDLGDRMILTPLHTHPRIGEEDVRSFLTEQAERHNVVVIVPSRRRARFWESVAQAVHDRDTIDAGVSSLRAGHVGLVVLVNKYDGIDLPGDACRILALDGLPEAYGAIERLEALALDETDAMMTRQIQRIEQGMGRAVRSNDDYCVVLLLGSKLTQRLNSPRAADKFSPATRAQIQLSRQVSDLLRDRPFADLGAVIEQCLGRDTNWVAASRGALDGVRYAGGGVSATAIAEREAFDLAEIGQYRQASERLQEAANQTVDSQAKGWIKQQSAAYMHFVDAAQAQLMQESAKELNRRILKPLAGISYRRLSATADQAARAAAHLGQTYADTAELIVGINAIVNDLVPTPDDQRAVERFEEAMHRIGMHIGFESQRPERDIGNGPDVLWAMGALTFGIIECKSGVDSERIARRDVAQLSHSMDWFGATYDGTCRPTPVIIHKTVQLHENATARAGTRVVTFDQLAEMSQAVRAFAESLATANTYRDPVAVQEQLNSRGLYAQGFFDRWGRAPR